MYTKKLVLKENTYTPKRLQGVCGRPLRAVLVLNNSETRRLFIILFVRNFWRVCSQFWLSVRNSVWGPSNRNSREIHHFACWEGGVKGHKNCEQKLREQTGVSYTRQKYEQKSGQKIWPHMLQNKICSTVSGPYFCLYFCLVRGGFLNNFGANLFMSRGIQLLAAAELQRAGCDAALVMHGVLELLCSVALQSPGPPTEPRGA